MKTCGAVGVVQPNLENVGLLGVGYRGLEALCADKTRWQFLPALVALPAPDRERLVRAFPDQFRGKLAIAARCLQETNQQQIRRRSEQHLNKFWGLDETGAEFRRANRFVREGASQRLAEGFSLGERSKLGRFLASEPGLDPVGFDTFLDSLLALLVRAHLNAVWLAQVRLPLCDRIELVINTDDEQTPYATRGRSRHSTF